MLARNAVLGLLLLTAAGCSEQKPPSGAPPAAETKPVPTAAAPTPAPTPTPARFSIVESALRPTARTPDGCVTLELDRQWHSVNYRRGPSPSCPTFEQSLPLLHEMLLAFDAYGDLGSVTSLGVGRDYAGFFERLATAAASSALWNARSGKPKEGHENAFVVALAHEPAAFFPELVTLLRGTHLRPELRSVEKVLIGKPSETPFADKLTAAGVPANAKLPYDCILGFHLVPES